MSPYRWDRWDQAVFEGLLVAAMAGVLVIGLLPALATGTGLCAARRIPKCESRIFVETDLDRPLPLTEEELVSPEGERAGAVSIGSPTTLTLIFANPTTAQRVLHGVPRVLGGATILLVLMLLLGIARTLRSGDPFRSANARRMTAIALLVLVGGTATPIVDRFLRAQLLQASGLPNFVTPVLEFSFLPMMVGLLLAFFAEVFRRGTKLREDAEGLV